jgi:hypothetical protein
MSPVVTRARATSRLAAVLGVGALVLASCGVAATTAVHLHGTPAFSISVPLSNVGCTRNDVCVAVGTSSVGVEPNAVGEYSTSSGHWINLTLPTSSSPVIDATACSGTTCLLGGSGPGNDLLWTFSAKDDAVNQATTPLDGIGIEALSCNGVNCALVDTGTQGDLLRLSLSSDGGGNWLPPVTIPWAKGDAVTALSCGSLLDCAIGTLSATHQFSLHVTLDGGITWIARSTPTAWTSLRSLKCEKRRCVAIASEGDSSALVRSNSFAKTWTSVALSHLANALACTALSTCYVVGQDANGSGWLANVHSNVVTSKTLRYVPTPLLGVACGSELCAAVGVTTLLSVPSTP